MSTRSSCGNRLAFVTQRSPRLRAAEEHTFMMDILAESPRAHSERSGNEGTGGAIRPAGRGRTARQAADAVAVGARDGPLRGRRRRL
jgi:hypothetical protein